MAADRLLRRAAAAPDCAGSRAAAAEAGVWMLHVGGAEANVAVGLACLGHRTAMVSRVPDNRARRGGDSAPPALRRFGRRRCASAGTHGPLFSIARRGIPASSTSSTTAKAAASRVAGKPTISIGTRCCDGAELLHLSGITPALGPRSAEAAIAAAEAAANAKGIANLVRWQLSRAAVAKWDGDPMRDPDGAGARKQKSFSAITVTFRCFWAASSAAKVSNVGAKPRLRRWRPFQISN